MGKDLLGMSTAAFDFDEWYFHILSSIFKGASHLGDPLILMPLERATINEKGPV